MNYNDVKAELLFIGKNPSLAQYRERYPLIYDEVSAEISNLLDARQPKAIASYIARLRGESEAYAARIKSSAANPQVIKTSFHFIAKEKIAGIMLDKLFLAISAGKKTGKVRFNLINGFLLQKILFKKNFERKPASLVLFTLVWPFITQKKFLMPLVAKKGISCFYSSRFIGRLAREIQGSAIEIAAGDGALSAALRDRKIPIQASDNQSWSHIIKYPDFVEKLDAKGALEKYNPETVICSWPTPGNGFEKHIFAHRSVKKYIVIASVHEFATGNWSAYRSAHGFTMTQRHDLSRGILPRENGNLVIVFERK